jgi:hypothetical protein
MDKLKAGGRPVLDFTAGQHMASNVHSTLEQRILFHKVPALSIINILDLVMFYANSGVQHAW